LRGPDALPIALWPAYLAGALSSAIDVLTRLPSTRVAIALAGLCLSAVSAPALASETSDPWATAVPQTVVRQLAVLPPPAPRLFAVTPERQALLNTIRYAEGTWKNGERLGYHVMFGGSLTPSLERHPNRVNYSSRYASAAAGAYQFMPFTWNMIVQQLGVRDFQPEAQDQGALFLIQRRGALHLVDRGDFSPELAARLAPEWASFPTLAGSSYYGQPVKRYDDLRRFYQENLAQLRQGSGQIYQNVAIQQVSRCADDSLMCRLEGIGPKPRSTASSPAVTLEAN
jgi:lysozyme